MASSHRTRNLLLAARDALLLGLPAIVYVVMIGLYRDGIGGFDLHVFWAAAHSVAHGVSPYDPAAVAHARALVEGHAKTAPTEAWAVYPPAVYVALIPLGLLPWHVAAAIGLVGVASAGFLALRVMGVRDWRCYLVACGSVPFAMSMLEGAISTLLMLCIALVWRGRLPVVASAAALVAKLFVWPFVFVVAGLHGFRRAGLVLVAAFAAAVGSWALIGFDDLLRYPQLLRDLSAAEAGESFSVAGLFHAFGASPGLGQDVGVLLGLAVAALAFRMASSGRRDAAFTLAIAASLLASPIVWTHYLVLLYLPLAVRAPRFSVLWLAFVPLWLVSPIAAKGHLVSFLVSWPCVALVIGVALWPMLGRSVDRIRPGLILPAERLRDLELSAAA